MSDENDERSAGSWAAGMLWRAYKAAIYGLAGPRIFSWLYGYDPEVQAWTSQNRLLITIFLGMVLIAYGMYDWMKEDEA